MDYGPWTMDHGPWTMDYRPIHNFFTKLRNAYYWSYQGRKNAC